MGLSWKKCEICGTKGYWNQMASKTKWNGNHRWYHPECVAVQAAAKGKRRG
jgi:hypothetical protein